MTTESTQLKAQGAVHVLAIVSFILSMLGLLPVLPLIGSIAGIVTGVIARKEIRLQPDRYSGDGFAKAAIILGWIGIGLALLAVLGVLLFLLPIRSISTLGIQPAVTVVPIP